MRARQLLVGVDLALALAATSIFLAWIVGFGISATLLFVTWFGIPLVVAFLLAQVTRQRFGTNTVVRASTSLVMATGIYYFAVGVSELLAFYVPFLGAELEKTSRGAGMGLFESLTYVVEGVVWSYPTVRALFPGSAAAFELGGLVLLVGIVLEASRYGITRKVKA